LLSEKGIGCWIPVFSIRFSVTANRGFTTQGNKKDEDLVNCDLTLNLTFSSISMRENPGSARFFIGISAFKSCLATN